MNVTDEGQYILQPADVVGRNNVIPDAMTTPSQTRTIHDTFLDQLQDQSAVFGIVLSIWASLLNIGVIYLCLRRKQERGETFYLQIVNFCISNLISGAFVIPLTVYYILYPWNIGDTLCKVWVVCDVFLPFVSTIILVILNIDRLLLLTHATGYMCLFQMCLKQVVLLVPWIAALVIVVPIWTFGTIPYLNDPGECVVIMTEDAALTSPIVTYFLPLIVMIVLTLKILIHKIKSETLIQGTTLDKKCSLQYTICETSVTNNESNSVSTNQQRTVHRVKYATADSIMALCLVNLFFAAMWFPFQCVSFLLSVCTSSVCVPSMTLNQTVTWTAAASAGVAPLFWLTDSNIRLAAMHCCCCVRSATRRQKYTERCEETCV